MKENLKLLRERLGWWNNEVFGWIDLKVDEAISEMN